MAFNHPIAFKILLEIMRRNIFGKFIKFSFWRFSAIFGTPEIQIGKSFEDDASRWRQLSSRFSDNLLTCLWSNYTIFRFRKTTWCHICFDKLKLAIGFSIEFSAKFAITIHLRTIANDLSMLRLLLAPCSCWKWTGAEQQIRIYRIPKSHTLSLSGWFIWILSRGQ